MSTSQSWLWNHIGRLSGLVLAVLALAGMSFLAAIGFRPALGLVIVIVVGLVMIAVGGRIHRA